MEVEVRNHLLLPGKVWHKKGNRSYLHREDGPAIMLDSGKDIWYYHQKEYNPKNMPLNLYLAYCKWEYNKQKK